MSQVANITLDTTKLDAIANSLNTNTDSVLHSIAFEVEGDAKMFAPVDTGALKNSINTQKIKRNMYHVQDGVEYGVYQELGTSRMGKQPFMVPAVERVLKTINKRFGRLFR